MNKNQKTGVFHLSLIAISLMINTANAGDVEVTLPANTDAFTVDQPVGTELMRVNGNGRVGIGTATPSAILHVQDGGTAPAYSGGTDKLTLISDGNTAMQITAGNTGNSAIMFSDPDSRSMGALDYNHADDSMRFRVNDLIRTVIDADGNMGIGTQTTSDASGSGGEALKLDVEGAVGATTYCDENGENCQNILQLASGGGGKFIDGTDTNDAVYTTGNVGVGTTTPGGQLHVAANGTIIPFMTDSEDGSASWWVHNSYRSSQYGPTLAFRKHHGTQAASQAITANSRIQEIYAQGYDGTALVDASSIITIPTEDWGAANHGSRMDMYAGSPVTGGKISLLSTGNVGVGTTAPRAGLDIANEAAIPLIVERTNTAGGGFVWQDFMADGDHQWRINGDSAAGDATANLKFSTNDGTTVTPRMTLTAQGNIGIGTGDPEQQLDVIGNAQIQGSLFLRNSSAPANNRSWWFNSNSIDGSLMLQALNDTPAGGGNTLRFTRSDQNVAQSQFLTSGSPFAVFDHTSRRMGIGTISPTSPIEVEGTGSSNDGLIKVSDSADSDEVLLDPNFGLTHSRTNAYLNNALPGGRLSLRVSDSATLDTVALTAISNGNVGIGTTAPSSALHVMGSITETSDERLKKDIKPINNALSKVMQLDGVNFQWKEESQQEAGMQVGLIAQQVEKVLPEVVRTSKDGDATKSVAYSNIVAVLIEAIKEQQKRIEKLESQINATSAK